MNLSTAARSSDMTKPDAWMPLFIGDYRRDTARLTCEQHGAYLQLIFDYWVAGPPPDDDSVLARIVGLDIRAWKKSRPVLERYFAVSGGVWRHKRIDEELAGASERSGKAAAKARAAAQSRWSKNREDGRTRDAPGIASSTASGSPQAVHEQCPRDAIHLTPVTLPAEEEDSSAGRAKRGGRLSPTWKPGPEDTAFGLSQGFTDAEVARIGEKFRDYWTAKAGKDGAKLDWRATWRNWVREEAERRPRRPEPRRVGFV